MDVFKCLVSKLKYAARPDNWSATESVLTSFIADGKYMQVYEIGRWHQARYGYFFCFDTLENALLGTSPDVIIFKAEAEDILEETKKITLFEDLWDKYWDNTLDVDDSYWSNFLRYPPCGTILARRVKLTQPAVFDEMRMGQYRYLKAHYPHLLEGV